jgi:phosphoribosylanthranilate isomerase
MLYHPILVRKIQHLTDARYFAAVGVDYMSLVLDESQLSFDRWHAIRDWVEGVSLVAEPSNENESLLAKIIIDAKPNGLLITPSMLPGVPAEIELFMMAASVINPASPLGTSLILELPAELIDKEFQLPEMEDVLFLQTDWTPVLVAKVLQQGYDGGFCFTGGKEEVTGMRDYNVMDDMISLLR